MGGRRGFSLVEAIVGAAVMLVLAIVGWWTFSFSVRGEGRDTRRSEAITAASELADQVGEVHARFQDLPLRSGCDLTAPGPSGHTLFGNPGGQVFVTPLPAGFRRSLTIEELRVGRETPLMRPDRAYKVTARVTYPGPAGETREAAVVTVRARPVVAKPKLVSPPWLEAL